MSSAPVSDYPVTFSVEYPEIPRNRLTVAFRLIVAIPILILIGTVAGGGMVDWGENAEAARTSATAGGLLSLPVLLMIVFRQKYPRWWFDWNLQLMRFANRVGSYLALLRDEYPSTDEEQAVHLDFPYPDASTELNRWMPLVKWLLAIPHFIVLIFLWLAAIVVTIIAWFAILFTGNHPRGMFDFVTGVMRWSNRVSAYAFVLVTDRYPPFRLDP
jgi:hypothetical protein